MGRAIVRTAYPTSGVTAFFDKIKGLLDVMWTGICVPSKLVTVTPLVGHTYLCRTGRSFMASKAKTDILLCVKGRAEKHIRMV
jgi:hypothetical protein